MCVHVCVCVLVSHFVRACGLTEGIVPTISTSICSALCKSVLLHKERVPTDGGVSCSFHFVLEPSIVKLAAIDDQLRTQSCCWKTEES